MNKQKSPLKKNRIIILVFLIILIIGNTYAWMIMSNQLTTTIDAHLSSWKIDFTDSSDTVLQNTYTVTIANIYPGMTDFEDVIDISNVGEIDGEIDYTIMSINILDDEYYSEEYRTSAGENIEQDDMTSDELIDMLENDLPFSISFALTDDELEVEETESFTTTVEWDYESGDDELDTLWGNNAYYFHEDNPSTPSIQIVLVIKVKQKAD